MRAGLLIWLLGWMPVLAAQKIQTIVPSQPVVIGTAFQVQYIIIDPAGFTGTTTPVFKDISIISGPNHYKGKAIIDGKMQTIENITYTLVPKKVGTLIVPGIHADFKDREDLVSENVAISVITKPRLSFSAKSSYTDVSLYAPSSPSDLDRLINENIFIRTEVSTKNCYVGEAITASFKLYSRLQSASELIRVPALYGFSVIDILDIKESHQAVETINGKVFNTSILRQVQLYPELSGELIIDEMVIKNEIEFDDSLDNDKKTVIQKELRSKPVVIKVRPLPVIRPSDYTGGVGQFQVMAEMENNLSVNEQGKLKVIVSGSGNFIQMGEPQVYWPAGLEVFDPVIEDELNTAVVPAYGKRTYTYNVAADSANTYTIPAIRISYFDPQKDSFNKIATEKILLVVQPASETTNTKDHVNKYNQSGNHWLIITISLAIAALSGWFITRKRKTKQLPIVIPEPVIAISSKIDSLDLKKLNDKQICIEISRLLSELERLNPQISAEQVSEIEKIKGECQLLAYSSMESTGLKESLKERALQLAQKLEI